VTGLSASAVPKPVAPSQRQRRGIFVASPTKMNFSPGGAAYSAPTELDSFCNFIIYKDVSPDGLGASLSASAVAKPVADRRSGGRVRHVRRAGWKNTDIIANSCGKESSEMANGVADFVKPIPAVAKPAADFAKRPADFGKPFPIFADRLPAAVGAGADFANDRPAKGEAGAAKGNRLENFEKLPPASVVVR